MKPKRRITLLPRESADVQRHPEASNEFPQYPGLGRPLQYELRRDEDQYPIGAHGGCVGSTFDPLAVREVAMMSIMERLTDKKNWHKKIFDEEIVAKWRIEALNIPDGEFWKIATSGKRQIWDSTGKVRISDDRLTPDCLLEGIMNDNTFDCIIKELRNKAKYFEKTGLIVTLDAYENVVKSDTLVSPKLHGHLLDAYTKLKADQSVAPDWHPNSNDMVQDLVHPSMYPLVYGRSRVLREELVGVSDAIDKWAGKGDIIEKETWHVIQSDRYTHRNNDSDRPDFWSKTYQWLPANVAFQDDGTVRFTSYINNLHPKRHPEIYFTIEKLIETALPAWDQCLKLARYTGGATSRLPNIEHPDDCNAENWIPSDPQEVAHIEVNWDDYGSDEYDEEYDDETEKKWELLRKPRIPEVSFKEVNYAPQKDGLLKEKFRESGLQVIVKMVSIELTPEKPDFPVGGWHIEGQLNEHICATALHYLDCENVTTSSLSFRTQGNEYLSDHYSVGQERYHWLEQIWGTALGIGAVCLQNYGSVDTLQGRLLAFPNVFQHRVSPFSLIDKTKPGHRRFIALWLVDPHLRIISTANVPPQQQDWWLDSVLGESAESQDAAIAKLPAEIAALIKNTSLDRIPPTMPAKLPLELMEMVRGHFDAISETMSMSVVEARAHRLKLMESRTASVKHSESSWQSQTYNFCEH
ncbi:hypothetical protein N0V90_009087 [Kalmusia sp. IMI 367209]|nr:hypothetical protein N0V90_009087 [Kalmusia sp. IMI 367209]